MSYCENDENNAAYHSIEFDLNSSFYHPYIILISSFSRNAPFFIYLFFQLLFPFISRKFQPEKGNLQEFIHLHPEANSHTEESFPFKLASDIIGKSLNSMPVMMENLLTTLDYSLSSILIKGERLSRREPIGLILALKVRAVELYVGMHDLRL